VPPAKTLVPTPTYTDISLAEFEQLRQQPGTAVVDVRDEWECDESTREGLNIPLADIRIRKAELLPYSALIVVCTNGIRSRVAAKDFLRQPELATKTIYHLHGGLIGDVG